MLLVGTEKRNLPRSITIVSPFGPVKMFKHTGPNEWELTLVGAGGESYGGTWDGAAIVACVAEEVS